MTDLTKKTTISTTKTNLNRPSNMTRLLFYICLCLDVAAVSCNSCIDGRDGRNGRNGKDGVDGIDGKDGKDASQKNWKECAWNMLDDQKDVGLVKNCAFKKKSIETYLKVTVSTNMRIYDCVTCCKRWFVTFDGKECSAIPIDGVVYMARQSSIPSENNVHRPRTIVGHCKVSKTGNLNVGLNIGNCNGYGDSDGQTGWNSSTHIIVEEVIPPQA